VPCLIPLHSSWKDRHGSSSFVVDDEDEEEGQIQGSFGDFEQVVRERRVNEAGIVEKFTLYLAYLFAVMIGARPWEEQELAAASVETIPKKILESTPTGHWTRSGLKDDLGACAEMSQVSDFGSVDDRCGGCGKRRERVGRFHLGMPFPAHPAAWHSERLFLHYVWTLDAADFLRIPMIEPSAEGVLVLQIGRAPNKKCYKPPRV
jgi:hypothetical protein